MDKESPCPLELGETFGKFKNELGDVNILNFFSLGPKNYSISFEKDGKIETISKVRGLSLSSVTNQTLLNEKLFQSFIDQYFKGKKINCKVPQYRLKGDFQNIKVLSNIKLMRFTNDISSRRVLKKNSDNPYLTYPYGYK